MNGSFLKSAIILAFSAAIAPLLVTITAAPCLAWGPTGHRIVGEIAQHRLSKKAASAVKQILDGKKLADVANWGDDIRSDDAYKAVAPYHYVSIPENAKSYADSPKSANGDVVVAINALVEYLKTGNQDGFAKIPTFATLNKQQALRLLVHFVGDIHQPLHAGYASDKGGNTVKVYFMVPSKIDNLHAVWDDEIIDHTRLSYTEYADILIRQFPSAAEADSNWATLDPQEWANEAIPIRAGLYVYPDKLSKSQAAMIPAGQEALPLISYNYIYKNRPLMEKRLFLGGVRLAHLLNTIFK